MATESYLTVTAHYIIDFKLTFVVLSTKSLLNGVNHTPENIAEIKKKKMGNDALVTK